MNERQLARQRRRQQNQRVIARSSLFLLGLVVGLLGGLYVAWVMLPGADNTAGVDALRPVHQADYLFMVSQSYAGDGDWELAAARLARLQDPAINEQLIRLLEQFLREGRPADQVRNLARLAQQAGADSPVLALFAPTPQAITAVLPTSSTLTPSPTPTLLPTPTPTVLPTATPSPTPTATPSPTATPTAVPAFRLRVQDSVCYPPDTPPLLEILVVDANLRPLPGVPVLVQWGTGEQEQDLFFTGYKPEMSLGYADFVMVPGFSYAVLVGGEGGEGVSGLQATQCPDEEGVLGWRLRWQNVTAGLAPTATP
jgi:hypothetical protein